MLIRGVFTAFTRVLVNFPTGPTTAEIELKEISSWFFIFFHVLKKRKNKVSPGKGESEFLLCTECWELDHCWMREKKKAFLSLLLFICSLVRSLFVVKPSHFKHQASGWEFFKKFWPSFHGLSQCVSYQKYSKTKASNRRTSPKTMTVYF